jgi:hypothetical protein
MSKTEQKNQRPSTEAANPETKKPYVKPEVRYERVFETMALSCGKTGPTSMDCMTNRSAS